MVKPISKKQRFLFVLLFFCVIGLVIFFSTPWKSMPAPSYSPLSDIQINIEQECTSFSHEIYLQVYDGTNQHFECKKPTLEYQHNGKWYQLKTPFYFWRGGSSMGIRLAPGETTTIYMNTTPYGYFLKSGHYRVVLSTTDINSKAIAVLEFDIS